MRKFFLSLSAICVAMMAATAQEIDTKNFQFNFISPVGTNGTQSHRTINKVSFNLLGGHSYGNTAFEFGCVYNIDLHHTKGFQFAGVLNYSGDSRKAAQFAGMANIAMKGSSPFQFAGMLNIAEEVTGVQFSGLVNIAQKVKGVQFGLVNYADESEGVSIGLINIIKHGGKQEFEVAFSEALHTSVSFKLGTDKLYTIFSGGANYLDSPVEYAAGLGLGTHIDWKKDWGNQIEVIGYSLTEEGKFHEDVNMLAQLKFSVSKELAPHFKVFAGPVLNMTISNYVHPETGEAGCSLSPWSMFSSNNGDTRLNGWIGFSAGVRF